MLLGFVVSERGIEANPEKISAIMTMGPIRNLKGVQRVTGCLAALNRFIAWLGERSLPLYKLMKKFDHFTWTSEAQEALDSLKNILKRPPILTALTTKEPMLVYISAMTQVVSVALVVEREEPGRSQKVQRPVYIRLCTFFFMAMLMLEQAASLHQGKDAPYSGATKGTMPSCPQFFFKIFQKKFDNFVETDRTSEKFLMETQTREERR
jgi:hypothetical protein